MNIAAAKKTKLVREIYDLPDEKLDSVKKFIHSLQPRSLKLRKKRISLFGIWKGKGFENIKNLESEIRKVRKEMQEVILKRKY